MFYGKIQRHCGGQWNLCLFTLLKERFQQPFEFFMKNKVYSFSTHCLNISQVFEGVYIFVVKKFRSDKCFWSHMEIKPVREACPVFVEILIDLAHYDIVSLGEGAMPKIVLPICKCTGVGFSGKK